MQRRRNEIIEYLIIPSSDPIGPKYIIKIKRHIGLPWPSIPDRSSYAVCEGATRPTNAEDATIVRDLIRDWPVSDGDRIHRVKHILNIADCLMNVHDGVVLAKAPANDEHTIVIDIDKPGDDWVFIPWG